MQSKKIVNYFNWDKDPVLTPDENLLGYSVLASDSENYYKYLYELSKIRDNCTYFDRGTEYDIHEYTKDNLLYRVQLSKEYRCISSLLVLENISDKITASFPVYKMLYHNTLLTADTPLNYPYWVFKHIPDNQDLTINWLSQNHDILPVLGNKVIEDYEGSEYGKFDSFVIRRFR